MILLCGDGGCSYDFKKEHVHSRLYHTNVKASVVQMVMVRTDSRYWMA